MVYDPRTVAGSTETNIRRLLLALLTFGLVGLIFELVAMGHYEDVWQKVPVGLVTVTLAVIGWQALAGSAASVRVFRVCMVLVIAAGLTGMILHFRGNMEFQLEMDPSQAGWALMTKVLHAKTPPALAPGVMAQLGLLGLIYAYRHPALSSSR